MTIIDTDKTLVANWFTRDHIEHFLKKKITDEKYQEIVDIWNNRGLYDNVSELIIDWLIDNNIGGE